MNEDDLAQLYNYEIFEPDKFERWMNFSSSPVLGEKVGNFSLWALDDRSETDLYTVLRGAQHTVVEFGSFT